jgi:hypothetical protein
MIASLFCLCHASSFLLASGRCNCIHSHNAAIVPKLEVEDQIKACVGMNIVPDISLILLSILPKGAVRDEATFFAMLSILIVLVIVALILRRRRLND